MDGFVYSMTNSAECNEVIAFKREIDGILTPMGSFKTNGKGTGREVVDPLVSQGSIAISGDCKYLFVVNAGSDSISSFRICCDGTLKFIDVVHSRGVNPNSLAVFEDLVYVTNVGDIDNDIPSNISGFCIDCGYFEPIKCATRYLSNPIAQPSSITFNSKGTQLIVAELSLSRISVFRLNRYCRPGCPVVNDSNSPSGFSLYFLSRGILLSAEAGTNALSSYRVEDNGLLDVVSGSVSTEGEATCWVVAGENENYAYTSNTASGEISAFSVSEEGELALIGNVESTFDGVGLPIDISISKDGKNLYALIGNQGYVSVFTINEDGTLTLLQVLEETGLPELGAQGIVAI